MKNFPDLPPVWTLATMVFSWVLAQLLPLLAINSVGLQWLGLLWIGLALLLILWSALWFRRKKTTIEPHHTPTALIVEGPYRLSRNPIYLAMVVASLGFALWCGALSSFLPVAALAFLLQHKFVLPEEAGLIREFGAEAEEYIAKTKRWV